MGWVDSSSGIGEEVVSFSAVTVWVLFILHVGFLVGYVFEKPGWVEMCFVWIGVVYYCTIVYTMLMLIQYLEISLGV